MLSRSIAHRVEEQDTHGIVEHPLAEQNGAQLRVLVLSEGQGVDDGHQETRGIGNQRGNK